VRVPVYSVALDEIPPVELASPATSSAEMIKSELVVEVFRPWIASMLSPFLRESRWSDTGIASRLFWEVYTLDFIAI
jgi:hypothetical protein